MESAAATQPAPRRGFLANIGDLFNGYHPKFWWGLLGLLAVVTLIGFFVLPTYPNYDTYYSLLWGRELFDGQLPSFEAYRAPTEHPLSVFFGAFLSLFGTGADRLILLVTLLSFVVLIAGVFRVSQKVFSPIVGLLAALLVVTRFDFASLAIRGYVDIPYLALIFIAAALEVARPKRGFSVMALLVAAGLLRPEAWVLIGIYYLYIAWDTDWSTRIKYAAFAAVAPVVWFGFDAVVTGDPLYSLNATKELAGQLDRQRPLSELPLILPNFFHNTVKLPVAILGTLGFLIGLFRFRMRMMVPTVLLLAGVLTFFASGAVGLSAIPRYLMVPSITLCIFAALALAGFAVPPRPSYWKVWAALSAVAVAFGVFYTVTHAPDLTKFEDEIAFQGDIHRSFKETVTDPAVREAVEKCGPMNTPTHKFLPEGRWLLDLPENRVIARSQINRTPRYGVAIYVFGRKATGRYGEAIDTDPIVTFVPAAGYVPVDSSRAQYTVAYVSCPKGVSLAQ